MKLKLNNLLVCNDANATFVAYISLVQHHSLLVLCGCNTCFLGTSHCSTVMTTAIKSLNIRA